ncbi:MAG: DUF4198 domain-containing protein [Aquabacterium sp.]
MSGHLPSRFRKAFQVVAAVALSALTMAAWAHDTWFEAQPGSASSSAWRLRLGTGAQFPVLESSPGDAGFSQLGCRQGQGAALPMRRVGGDARAALLEAKLPPPRPGGGLTTCWAQLLPYELELKPALIEAYFKEIAAPQAVRNVWASWQAQGRPFTERYTKHARIETWARSATEGQAQAGTPAPLGMDIVLDEAGQAPRRGQVLRFQVLRDGVPLADQPIEARSALSPLGLWLQTDAQGRAEIRLPLAGRWLLRGTDLRPSESQPMTWESRFVTLAFDAVP